MFSLNLFRKASEDVDPHDYWAEDVFPLDMEQHFFPMIERTLANWIQQDIQTASLAQVPLEACVSYQLAHIDVKFLPFTGSRTKLFNILKDNSVYSGATRFFDAINYLGLVIPSAYIITLRKRFFYSQAFLMPDTLVVAEEKEPVSLPTYRQWLDFLKVYEWVIFLPILQSIYDEDSAILKLKELSQAADGKIKVSNRPSTSIAPQASSDVS